MFACQKPDRGGYGRVKFFIVRGRIVYEDVEECGCAEGVEEDVNVMDVRV